MGRGSSTESLVDGSFGGGIVSQGASMHALPDNSPERVLDPIYPKIDLSPGGLSASPGMGATSLSPASASAPLITRSSLPLSASNLPPVTIGVGHLNPVSNKVVTGSLKNLSKIGYSTYGVEMPIENQAGINSFVSIYDKTGNLAKAKEGFWQTMLDYWHTNPEKYGSDWAPETVRAMDLDGLKSSDASGNYESLFGRMVTARAAGMTVEAIDAPQTVVLDSEKKVLNAQQQLNDQGVTSTTIGTLKQIGNDRNGYLAGNLRPGMVAEIGALHTDGPGSVNALSASSGKPTISFDAYNPITTPTANDSSYGGANLNKAPSVDTMIKTLNTSPKM